MGLTSGLFRLPGGSDASGDGLLGRLEPKVE